MIALNNTNDELKAYFIIHIFMLTLKSQLLKMFP